MYSACEWGEWKSFSHGKLFVTPICYRVHEILQTRILEWVAVPFSRASSQPREQTQISHIAGRFFTSWATRKLNKQDDNIQPCTPFSVLNQSIVPCLVLIVAPWPTKVSQETGKVVWYSHMLKNFPQFVVIHKVKGFSIVNEAKVDVFLEFPCFLPISLLFLKCWQFSLWFLCLFLNPAWTSRSSQFTYC